MMTFGNKTQQLKLTSTNRKAYLNLNFSRPQWIEKEEELPDCRAYVETVETLFQPIELW